MGGKVSRSLRGKGGVGGLVGGLVGTAALPVVGTAIGAGIGNTAAGGKFGQTTWNRLQGGWAGGSGRKRKSPGDWTAAGSVVEGGTVGGDDMGSVAEAYEAGALSEARTRRRGSGLVLEGPDTFTGGYGTIGG